MRTKNIAMILTLALTAGLCQTAAPSQAATPKLSAKNLTIKVGKTAALDRPEPRQQTSPMPSTMEQVPSCFRERRLQGNIRWKP